MLRHLAAWYRNSLRVKISLPILAALLFLVTALMVASEALLKTVLSRTWSQAASQLANVLAEDPEIVEEIARGESRHTARRLEKICRSIRDVVAIAAYIENPRSVGFVRACEFQDRDDAGIELPAYVIESFTTPLSRSEPRGTGPGLVYITVPITTRPVPGGERSARTVGALSLVYSLRHAREQAWIYRTIFLLIATFLFIFGFLTTSRVASQILRPLRGMLRAMSQVSDGRHAEPLEGHSPDELGAVAEGFNEMSARLAEKRDQIERHAKELEQRVKERSDALSLANDELRTLEAAKEAFLSNISHEMRTPLTAILASAEILNQFAGEDDTTREEFLEIIQREAQRLSQTIDSVLELAKLEAEADALTKCECDVHDVVARVVDALTQRATDARVVIECRDADAPILIDCDLERVALSLRHLIENAIKFSPEGGSVDIRVVRTGSTAEIRVSDRGPGIDAEEIRKVFGSFGQGGVGLTNKPEGVGLGLAIASRIARAHGGNIEHASDPGWSTTFVLRLPVSRADVGEVEVAERARRVAD